MNQLINYWWLMIGWFLPRSNSPLPGARSGDHAREVGRPVRGRTASVGEGAYQETTRLADFWLVYEAANLMNCSQFIGSRPLTVVSWSIHQENMCDSLLIFVIHLLSSRITNLRLIAIFSQPWGLRRDGWVLLHAWVGLINIVALRDPSEPNIDPLFDALPRCGKLTTAGPLFLHLAIRQRTSRWRWQALAKVSLEERLWTMLIIHHSDIYRGPHHLILIIISNIIS